MGEDVSESERVINVRDIDPRHRHMIIFQLFEHLGSEDSLQLVVDHDPRRLRLQLEAKHGSRCRWTYLAQGPTCGASGFSRVRPLESRKVSFAA